MAKKKIDINSNENADWIKQVRGGRSNKKELAIHKKLEKKNKPNA